MHSNLGVRLHACSSPWQSSPSTKSSLRSSVMSPCKCDGHSGVMQAACHLIWTSCQQCLDSMSAIGISPVKPLQPRCVVQHVGLHFYYFHRPLILLEDMLGLQGHLLSEQGILFKFFTLGASSRADVRVRASTAALLTQYAMQPGKPVLAAILLMLTMLPLLASKQGMAACSGNKPDRINELPDQNLACGFAGMQMPRCIQFS